MSIIWTNHLKSRLNERGIDQREVDQTIRFPSLTKASRFDNSVKHIKHFDHHTITATVKRSAGDWIVTTVWKNPATTPKHKQFFLERLIGSLVERIMRNPKS